MKTILLTLALTCLLSLPALAQGGISVNTTGATPDNSAMLDVQSTTKGILIPRMTETQRNAIASPATGLMVYQTDATAGFYYYNGASWQSIGSASFTETDPKVGTTTTGRLARWNGTSLVDGLLFDDGTNVGLGTTLPASRFYVASNNVNTNVTIESGTAPYPYALNILPSTHTNSRRSALRLDDWYVLQDMTGTGTKNFSIYQASTNIQRLAIATNGNVGIGTDIASPADKLHIVGKLRIDAGKIDFRNTGNSVFIGEEAGLNDDLTDNRNVYTGYQAGQLNTTGITNVGLGYRALASGTNSNNTALGAYTGETLTTGFNNVIIGESAMRTSTTAYRNVAIGTSALRNNLTGFQNTAVGVSAGNSNTGFGNVFLGYQAGANETGNDKLYIANTGTSSPLIWGDFAANLLRVNGTLNVNNAYSLPTVAGSANQYLQTNGAGVASWVTPSFLSTETDPKVGTLTTNYLPKWNGTSLANGLLFDNGTNIGVGTTSPTEKLEVVGKIKATDLQMTTGATNGYVLQSDASGNATWVNPTTLPITESDPKVGTLTTNYLPKWNGTNLANGLLFDNGTNVGLGTALPADKLHVVGNARIDAGRLDFRNTGASVFIGQDAGLNDDFTANDNTFVGHESGRGNTTGSDNVALGVETLRNNTTNNYNIAIGSSTMRNATGLGNIAMGLNSAYAVSGTYNIAIGQQSGQSLTTGNQNLFLGFNAGRNIVTTSNNVFLGYLAGENTTGSGNIFVGSSSGRNETGSNKLYIDNSNTTTPLIYGEFDNNLLRVNGTLNVNNAYNLPTVAGTANQILQTNGAGTASWVTPSFLSTETDPKIGTLTTNYLSKWNGTSLVDGLLFDNGTNVGVGTTSPTEKLEVVGKTKTTDLQMTTGATNGYVLQSDASGNATWVNPTALPITESDPKVGTLTTNYLPKWNGTSLANGLLFDNGTNVGVGIASPADKLHVVGNARIEGGRLGFYNTGRSVYVGREAGILDNFSTDLENVAVGLQTLFNNSSGNKNTAIGTFSMLFSNSSSNVAVGYQSMRLLTSGNNNVALGANAGLNNLTGSGNVFLGYQAGFNETGSNKLYMDNSNTTSPLLYGEFDNNLLRINGTLNVNNAYNLPTIAGTANQYLQTNGAGVASWVTPSFLSTESDPKVGTLTTNYLPKWNGTSLTNGLLFDNGTNVGLGTASPADKLHVVGNARIDAGRLDFRNTGNSVFIGQNAGNNDNLTNTRNTVVGTNALQSNVSGTQNTAIGYNVLINNTANSNTGVGSEALKLNTTGIWNVALGQNTLLNNTTGSRNVALGGQALGNNLTGNRNISIGMDNMLSHTSGDSNISIGMSAGSNNITGAGNIFLGNAAGENETGSNKLYIDNSNTASPLLYGEFDTNLLRINGTLNINNAYSLPTVAGTANQFLQTNGTGMASWVTPSFLSTEIDPKVGTLTTNYLPKWNGTSLANGLLFDDGTNVGLGTITPTEKLEVVGKTKTTTLQMTTGATNGFVLQSDASGNGTWVNPTSLSITESDPQVASSTTNYIPKWNGTSLVDGLLFDNGTNVGIGTTTPTQARLVVNGSQNFTTAYGYLNSTGATGTFGSATNAYSIYASARIAATEFNAYSDARIKKVKGITNNANDLATLANIRITDYTHIDSIAKGNNEIKKVIAQELKTVYPQAVSTMTDVVPDIYKQAEINNGFVNLPTDLKAGEKVKIIFATGEEVLEVAEVKATGFRVNSNRAGKVFVFGRQVNDFHVVDYEALSTLNISATQELLKRIEALEAENKTLKTANQEMQNVKTKVTHLEKQMADIQALLQQSARK